MAVVGCLTLCSKFAKNRLSAWLCPYPLGELTALPSWIKGEGRGKGRWKGRRGRGGKLEKAGERKEGNGYPLRMNILATALQATVVVNGFYDSAVYVSALFVVHYSVSPVFRRFAGILNIFR